MSLYNLLFGVRKEAPVVLAALGIAADDVPRFRDAYFDDEGDRLVLHTRTGGGNREAYEDENEALTLLDGYLSDEDDDFDSTYANFYFQVPDAFAPVFKALRAEYGPNETPAARWGFLLSKLREGDNTPETQRAIEVGASIIAQLETATSSGSAGPDETSVAEDQRG